MTPERLEALIAQLGTHQPEGVLSGASAVTIGELREYLSCRLPHTKLTAVTGEQAEEWADALADCLCWFGGFSAAARDSVDMPPRWTTLRTIKMALQQHAEAIREADAERRRRPPTQPLTPAHPRGSDQ